MGRPKDIVVCKERQYGQVASALVIVPRHIEPLWYQQPVNHFDYWYLPVANNLSYGVPCPVQAIKEDIEDGRPYFPPFYLDGVELGVWGGRCSISMSPPASSRHFRMVAPVQLFWRELACGTRMCIMVPALKAKPVYAP